MDDLIKRQDAIDACFNGKCANIYDCKEAIEKIPSAQKTGRWKLLRKGNDTSDYKCTNCLGILMDVANDDHHELQRYCGMCGAKMENES